MEQDQQAQGDTVGAYMGVLRRRWVTLFLVAGAVFALGAGWMLAGAGSYRANAAVLVEPIAEPCTDATRTPDVNLANEREIADSLVTAAVVKEELKSSETPQALLRGLQVEALPETEILRFAYTAKSGSTARERAQGFSEGYLAARAEAAEKKIDACKTRLDEDVTNLSAQLADIIARTDLTATGSAERAQLTAERTGVEQQLRITQERLVGLRSVETVGGRIVKSASSSHPVAITRSLVLLAAAALVLGAIAAFLRDRFDQRLRSADDVRRAGLPPVLAEVGQRGRGQDGRAGFGRLRARLRSAPGATEAVLVAGIDGAGGTTAVASGLASSYRGTRRALVAVGGTAREVERSLGLEAAVGEDGAWVVRPAPQITGLSVVTGLGEDGTSAAEIRRCLDTLRGEFDVVIAVLEPLDGEGPLDVATLFDAVVVVIDASSSRIATIASVVQDLREAGGSVVGSVLVARS